MTQSNPSPASDLQQRLIGAAFIAFGLVLSYFFVYVPYQGMAVGAPTVEFGFKSAIVGPLVFFIGVGHAALGARAPAWFGREGPLSLKSVVLGLVIVGLSIAVYYWLKSQAAAFGYA